MGLHAVLERKTGCEFRHFRGCVLQIKGTADPRRPAPAVLDELLPTGTFLPAELGVAWHHHGGEHFPFGVHRGSSEKGLRALGRGTYLPGDPPLPFDRVAHGMQGGNRLQIWGKKKFLSRNFFGPVCASRLQFCPVKGRGIFGFRKHAEEGQEGHARTGVQRQQRFGPCS